MMGPRQKVINEITGFGEEGVKWGVRRHKRLGKSLFCWEKKKGGGKKPRVIQQNAWTKGTELRKHIPSAAGQPEQAAQSHVTGKKK